MNINRHFLQWFILISLRNWRWPELREKQLKLSSFQNTDDYDFVENSYSWKHWPATSYTDADYTVEGGFLPPGSTFVSGEWIILDVGRAA